MVSKTVNGARALLELMFAAMSSKYSFIRVRATAESGFELSTLWIGD